jgi:hypothetical protein
MAAVPRFEAHEEVLTPEDHKGFGRLFDTLHVHPYNAQKAQTGGAADPEMRPEIGGGETCFISAIRASGRCAACRLCKPCSFVFLASSRRTSCDCTLLRTLRRRGSPAGDTAGYLGG